MNRMPQNALIKSNEPQQMKGRKNMKKHISLILAAILLLSLLPAAALAQSAVNLSAQNGRLLISEEGTYTLTGSMLGTVWVDPGKGSVTLILDNITIDGSESAGIAAVSGDALTVILADGTRNRVRDGGNDSKYDAAIFCGVPTRFEGNGRLDVIGSNKMGIRGQNADLTFASGSYFIQGPAGSIETNACLSVLNAQVMDMNSSQFFAATPLMFVQTSSGDRLNLREEADENSSVIAQYADWTVVAMLENQGEWSQVVVDGQTGYMRNQYLNPVQWQTVESLFTLPQAMQGIPAVSTQPVQELPAYNTQPAQGIPVIDMQPAQSIPTNNSQPLQELPGNSEQPQAVNQGTLPQKPTGSNEQQNNGNSNASGGAMTPGGLISTADSPSEIVTGTSVNAASSLEADMDNANYITMSEENNQVKISESGTYVVTGSSSDGNITVKKGTTGVVLVLENLDLTSRTGATVSVNKEAEVKIIVSGQVILTDAENPDDENSTNEAVADAYDGAAMKFKANSQVYITGSGVLTINGNARNGIKAGDDSSLIIDGGVIINITAVHDGINGNYDITLLNGIFTINAGDDAIHADHILTVGSSDGTGPSIQVTGCNEGLEGTVVNVFGGDITVRATDDAINAANGDGLYEGALAYAFNMLGGRINLTSTNGDGIDSNGHVNLIGGSASISSVYRGGDAGIDYDGQLYVSEAFQLNNQSGTAGPDGMPGQMNTQNGGMPGQMNTQNGGMPGQMNEQNGAMPGQMDAQSGGLPDSIPSDNRNSVQNQPPMAQGQTANGRAQMPAGSANQQKQPQNPQENE